MPVNPIMKGAATPLGAAVTTSGSALPYRKRRRTGAWIVSIAIVTILATLALDVAHTRAINFAAVPRFLLDPRILAGVKITLVLTVAGLVIGVLCGLLLACARLSRIGVARTLSATYTWAFLSVPGLVQLIFWYNLAIVFPHIHLELPFLGTIWEGQTNAIITAMTASMIGLGLHEAAYFSEIIRSGIISVDRGQVEAAQSLGIRSRTILFKIVMPQALRVMLPSGMTRVVALMKDTSLVAVIGGGDIMTHAQEIYSDNFLIIELLLVVSAWYLFMVSALMLAQAAVERWASRYQRSSGAAPVRSAVVEELA
ncbi:MULTISPECIES: amino acid ABC transporter permease [unclassified Caballeronia]|uniref:amino acid ABC transporter permease n=1 Tax=unclassified Caballeronia TaxID=2646786 RepID=UPI00285A5E9F|nr:MULTISPECIES: amino acid ABC transporter permease [unclassified Caballeronia]MDR5818693.1 amino acid ABC transporter permease [Caballeronia sp. LZ033]MDR5879916.1 amino acid ABC transporter permease [Caballeronia sp. LZ032]